MRISRLSEQRLVVVLFIMVLVTFFFAQADTSRIEKMYLNSNPSVTTSLQPANDEESSKAKEMEAITPAVHLR